jgi:uncharacterized membrane protein YuzA (DUF378 family)
MVSLNLSVLDWLCFVLLIVGAITWGIIGIAEVNLVEQILEPVFQPDAAEVIARAIYVLVGLAGLYFLYPLSRMTRVNRRDRTRDAAE